MSHPHDESSQPRAGCWERVWIPRLAWLGTPVFNPALFARKHAQISICTHTLSLVSLSPDAPQLCFLPQAVCAYASLSHTGVHETCRRTRLSQTEHTDTRTRCCTCYKAVMLRRKQGAKSAAAGHSFSQLRKEASHLGPAISHEGLHTIPQHSKILVMILSINSDWRAAECLLLEGKALLYSSMHMSA